MRAGRLVACMTAALALAACGGGDAGETGGGDSAVVETPAPVAPPAPLPADSVATPGTMDSIAADTTPM